MTRELRLLAITPSGEAYIAEIDGHVWLVPPPGAGDPRQVDPVVVARAVTYHGFDRVDQVFDSAAALDAYRDEVAAKVAPEIATRWELFDEADVQRMLVIARQWHVEGDDRGDRLARRLLDVPVVQANPSLAREIVNLIRPAKPIDVASPGTTPIGKAARERFKLEPAA